MKLIDSSVWIEYLANGQRAEEYEKYIVQTPNSDIVTPTVVMFEVYRKVKKDNGEERALEAYAHLDGTRVVPLNPSIALAAADLSLKTGLGTVDSIIYATADRYRVELLTSDHHFRGLPRTVLV